jgi:arylsulfatase A-like enzyme
MSTDPAARPLPRAGAARRLAPLAVLALVLLTLLGPATPAAAGGPQASDLLGSRPDIIVLMLDDMNADAFPRVLARLPALKAQFVDQGIRFPNTFAENPLCCPARANFLTGLTTAHNGVNNNDARHLDPSVTIATRLQAAGYFTMIAGKYLNLTNLLEDRSPPGWDKVDIMSGAYYHWTEYRQDEEIVHEDSPADYSTDVFADQSVTWLENAPEDKPRFVFLTPYAPHADSPVGWRQPRPAPRHEGAEACADIGFRKTPAFNESLEDRADRAPFVRRFTDFETFPEYDPRGWSLVPTCESMLAVDEWFARIVAVQEAQGRLDRTLFVLIGDNGISWGDHGYFPKSVSWTTPVPLYLSWPAMLGGLPSRNTAFVTNTDLAPTFAKLAGTNMGPYPSGQTRPDGRSLVATIAAGTATNLPRTGLVEEHHRPDMRTLDWVALRTTDKHPCGRWHLTRWRSGFIELFNLKKDPWELTNLASSRPRLVQQLDGELRAIRAGGPKPATRCTSG